MKYRAWITCGFAIACWSQVWAADVAIKPADAKAAFTRLADQLAHQARLDRPVRVAVGRFVNAHTDALTPFSNVLREGIEAALASGDAFDVISRNRLADLQEEAQFQKSRIIDSESGPAAFSIKPIDGLVRGSYFTAKEKILIFAEIAWLEGGRITKVQAELDRTQFPGANYWDDELHASLNREKVRLHILTSAFSADVLRENPGWVRQLKSRGFDFSIWTTLEDEFGEHPAFELFMEPESDNEQFVKALTAEKPSIDRANAMISVITKVYTRPGEGRAKETFTIEVALRYFNLENKPWNRSPVIASGIVQRADDPLIGARAAAKMAAAELIQRLRKRGIL